MRSTITARGQAVVPVAPSANRARLLAQTPTPPIVQQPVGHVRSG